MSTNKQIITLLVIDVQNEFFFPTGVLGDEHIKPEIIQGINNWIQFATKRNYQIIFIQANYERLCIKGTFNHELCKDLLLPEQPIIIEKTSTNSFKGTSLHSLLQENETTDLIITGVTTNTCVLHTSLAGSKLGYKIFVPRNATGARNKNAYNKAITKITSECNLIRVIRNILDPELSVSSFDNLIQEINWQKMYHKTVPVSRDVETQGILDGSWYPLYRFPTDIEFPITEFTPTSKKIYEQINSLFGPDLNHAKIQLYKDGQDHIGKHSDKTLDIKHDSYIINFSLGETRTFCIQDKVTKEIEQFQLDNNSLFILDLTTNRKYVHYVIKSDTLNPRISIVYRTIDTFKSNISGEMKGQGAGKCLNVDKLIECFKEENKRTDLDWIHIYGDK